MNYSRSYFEFKVAEIKGAYPDGCVVRMCADDPNIKMGTIGIVDFVTMLGRCSFVGMTGKTPLLFRQKIKLKK